MAKPIKSFQLHYPMIQFFIIIIIHRRQLSVLMINLTFSFSSCISPPSVLSISTALLAKKINKSQLSNSCKLFAMHFGDSVFSPSFRSAKVTKLICILKLHVCIGYTRLYTSITITGILNYFHLHDNYKQNNGMEGKIPRAIKGRVVKW